MRVEACSAQGLDAVRVALESFLGEPVPEMEALMPSVKMVSGASGIQVYSEHETHPYAYLVIQGIAQMSAKVGGRSVILGFAQPQQVFGGNGLHMIHEDPSECLPPDFDQFNSELQQTLLGEAPGHDAETVTEFSAIRFDMREVAKLTERSIEWSRLINVVSIMQLSRHFQKLKRHMLLSSEARYELMLREEPEVIRHVQQKHLAQYLGVTPEGLSRISTRLRKNVIAQTDKAASEEG